VITRKAYGGAYDVMGSKHLGADVNLAWPTAQIAVMGAQGAVNLLYRKELAASENPDALRAKLIQEYEDTLLNPYIAAERGFVDAVIHPHETRIEVVRALRMLRTKRETLPPRKHGNIPLRDTTSGEARPRRGASFPCDPPPSPVRQRSDHRILSRGVPTPSDRRRQLRLIREAHLTFHRRAGRYAAITWCTWGVTGEPRAAFERSRAGQLALGPGARPDLRRRHGPGDALGSRAQAQLAAGRTCDHLPGARRHRGRDRHSPGHRGRVRDADGLGDRPDPRRSGARARRPPLGLRPAEPSAGVPDARGAEVAARTAAGRARG